MEVIRIDKIIDNYIYDYHDMAMNRLEMQSMLTNFLNECLEEIKKNK